MTLQFIDKLTFASVIADAWQNHLNTAMDPANGQWYAHGPNNNGGLFGQLTDRIDTKLEFLTGEQIFSQHKEAVATGIADNRNGLTPNMTLALSYSYNSSATTSHASTNAFKIGASYSISGKAQFMEHSFSISTEYSHSWTETTTETEGKTITATETVPLTNIPAGKVWQVSIMCDRCTFTMPYHADIIISGTSRTNFATKVNGQTIWDATAGHICAWIALYKSGPADVEFLRNPGNEAEGLARVKGKITASQSFNFTAVTEDITSSFEGKVPPGVAMAKPA